MFLASLPNKVQATPCTHVYYATQCPDSVRSVNNITPHRRVLHDAARNHNNILGGTGQLLDDKVDHLAEGGIFVLEQLGDTEEEVGGFPRRELFAGEEKQSDLGEQNAASSGRHRRGVEDASCPY
jgi:hypothetical protein